jgi:hypothetical protein
VGVGGARDRRAGASPAFADGVVLCTGAAFERDPAALVRRTREAADLLRLPPLADGPLRELAAAHDADLLVSAAGEAIPIDPQLVLAGSAEQIAALLRARPDARHVVVRGALCEAFLEGARAGAGGRQLTVVVADATRVFLARRSVELYRARGVAIEVLAPIDLRAITVNPLAPPAHRLDGPALRARLGEAIPGVPVLDVLEAGYTAHPAHAALTAAGVAG